MDKNLKESAILIDCSALQGMFEGKTDDKSKQLLDLLKKGSDEGKPLKVLTTLSSFLRAIFLADPKTSINDIQKTLSFLDVAPSFADFKDEEKVRKELILFAKAMSGDKDVEK